MDQESRGVVGYALGSGIKNPRLRYSRQPFDLSGHSGEIEGVDQSSEEMEGVGRSSGERQGRWRGRCGKAPKMADVRTSLCYRPLG